jgi:hypothetical protein
MSDPRATQLRHRARHLRELATAIEQTAALGLDGAAGEDTWRGQRPLLCTNLLATNQRQAHDAIDGLRWQAYLFEQQAAQLDAAHALGRHVA